MLFEKRARDLLSNEKPFRQGKIGFDSRIQKPAAILSLPSAGEFSAFAPRITGKKPTGPGRND